MSKTVDEYLNELSYVDLMGYQPSEFALNMVNVIKLIEGGSPENKTPVVHYKFIDTLVSKGNAINMCHRGFAKLERASNRLLTVDGWKTMRDIQVGDQVITMHGKPAYVDYKTEPKFPRMFRMTLSDGTSFEIGDEHNHVVLTRKGRAKVWTTKVVTTLDMLNQGLTYNTVRKSTRDAKAQYRFKIPLVKPIEFPEKLLNIAPYTMGYGLANGSFDKSVISFHTDDALEIQGYISNEGYTWMSSRPTSAKGIQSKLKGHIFKEYSYLRSRNKYIPKDYLFGSLEQRKQLLQGLMDGDGTIQANGSCKYSTYSEQLAKDITDLARSLGGLVKYASYIHADTGKEEYVVTMALSVNPFKLKRKATKWKPTNKISKQVIALEEVPLEEEGYCIRVDSPCHTYITEGYTVTHNTTVKEYLMWYVALFGELPLLGEIPYALYVSDSMDNGIKKMRYSMEGRYHKSEFLQKYIPKAKFTDNRWDFTNADGHRFVVTGHGAQTGVRGTRENNSRPVLALLDDLFSDTDAKSPTVITNVEDTIYKAIFAALHPTKRKIIWSGTPFNAGDPLYKGVESGAWNVNVFPVCEQFPCEPEEFRGSWPDRFTYDSVKEAYDMMNGSGRIEAFNQELMLRIMSDEDRVIEPQDIQWYERHSAIKRRNQYNCYITTDIAVSDKTSADFMVISVWFVDHKGNWFYVDGICKKQLIDATYDDLFRFVQIYKPISVGIEVSGQQGMLIPLLQKEMNERGCWFTLASEAGKKTPGIRPTSNKFTRFNSIVPWFKSRKMFFPIELKDSVMLQEGMNELSLVAKGGFKSKHDDFLDTISMLGSMHTYLPNQEVEYSYNEAKGLWEEEAEDAHSAFAYDSYLV